MLTRREVPPRKSLSKKNLSLMGIPRLYFDAEIKDYKGKKEKRIISRYIDNIHDMFDDCINITFFGKNGSGKSFLSCIILKNAYRCYYSAQLVTVSKLISLTFKGASRTDEEDLLLERIHNVEFLVLDELGKEVTTQKGNELSVLIELMKYREEKGLPVIICTNLPLDDIDKNYGKTFMSLINQSVTIEMIGEDGREEAFGNRRGLEILMGDD